MLWKANLDGQWYATVSGEHEGQYLPVAREPKAQHEDQIRAGLEATFSDDVAPADKPVLPYRVKSINELVQAEAEVWAEAEVA